jgi:hypothetical protein
MKNSPQTFPWIKIEGEVPALMRTLDWSACAIGSPDTILIAGAGKA